MISSTLGPTYLIHWRIIMKKYLGMALLGALALSGCGNDKQDQFGGNFQAQIQGPCEPRTVADYNYFAQQCNQLQQGMNTQREVHHCRQAAKNFLQNWGQIACVAEVQGYQQFQRPGFQQQFPGQGQQQFPGNNGWQYNDQFMTQYQGRPMMVISSQPMQMVLNAIGYDGNPNRNWSRNYSSRWRQVR